MIYIERTINIEDNSAYIEEPVILYKGDRNIEVQFIIKNNPFKYKAGIDLTYGQLVIKRPTTNPIFSEVAKVSSGKVLFVITGDMIDELAEIGNYDFQIRLLNSDLSSRATLPPVSAGFMVKEPICEESVNSAPVNYSRAVINREVEGTFDEEGNYNKTDWSNGDIITDSKLNKIEDALYTVNDSKATKDDIPTDVSAFTNDAGYINDISHLAAKDELPTNVSELTNDAGYLTEHQSLEAYALKADIPSTDGLATEQYVDELIGGLDVSYFPNSIGYVTKQYVDDAVANVDVDLTGYATEAYVQDAIDAIELPEGGGDVDLSNYVTKDETIGTISGSIPSISTNTSLASKLPEGLHLFKGVSISYKKTETTISTTSLALDDDIVRVSRYEDTEGNRGTITELYCYGSSTTYKFYVKKGSISSFIILLSQESNTTDLSGYATKEELQTTLGDIESLLGGI